jgi:hypothetical protein
LVHGSKNPFTKEKMGNNNLSAHDFLKGIKEIEKKLKLKVIVIHCYYPPQEIIPLCKEYEVEYSLLLRNPVDQVKSCYSYGLTKILKGDQNIFKEMTKSSYDREIIFDKLNIDNNLANNLYFWALFRVILFNLNAIQMGSKVYKMEELLNNMNIFSKVFKIEFKSNLKQFKSKKINSHKSSIEIITNRIKSLNTPEEDQMLNNLSFSIRNMIFKFSDVEKIFGYHKSY